MDFLKHEFGKKLSKAIDDAGLTQEQFAELMGVEPPSVSRWVNGVNQPVGKRKKKLFEILGIDESYFLTKEVEKKSPLDQAIMLTEAQLKALSEDAAVKGAKAALDAINKPIVSKQDTKNLSEKDKLILEITASLPLLNVNNLTGINNSINRLVTPSRKIKKPVNS